MHLRSSTILILVGATLLFGACNDEGHANSQQDLSMGSDLSEPIDMSMPDLATPSCGQIVLCVVQCGVTNFQCDQSCAAGAQPAEIAQAGLLALCAAQNCLATDGGAGLGGGGNPLGILSCLQQQCSSEVSSCKGLPFGGSGPN